MARIKKVRKLLGDWEPPAAAEPSARLPAESSVELPETVQARLHTAVDHEYTAYCSVTLQRCGGGRRIIRKQKEGN